MPKAPQGVLDTPVRVLCGFAKTKELAAGEEEHITLEIPKNTFASYDDSGVTGHRDCFVLLEGTYTILCGEPMCGRHKRQAVIRRRLQYLNSLRKSVHRRNRLPV